MATTVTATSLAVIVTNYNYCRFVIEAVDSVLAQTRAAKEIIVVDDGSTDGSRELLCERYGSDARITLLFQENGGQLAAFQAGSRLATADVLCFLDADDRWKPDYLAKVGRIYDEHRNVDFVFSDLALFGDETGAINFARHEVDLGFTAVATYYSKHWYGAPTSAISLRRRLAVQALNLPESIASLCRISADNALVFGASILGGHKYYLPTGCVDYRIHGKNGWWSIRDADGNYRNRIRTRALVAYYGQQAGLAPYCVDLLKQELKTKPNPPWTEIKRYASIAWHRHENFLRKIELWLGILVYGLLRRGRQWRNEQ